MQSRASGGATTRRGTTWRPLALVKVRAASSRTAEPHPAMATARASSTEPEAGADAELAVDTDTDTDTEAEADTEAEVAIKPRPGFETRAVPDESGAAPCQRMGAHIAGALPTVTNVFRAASAMGTTQFCELEARLGRASPATGGPGDGPHHDFTSGVSKDFAARALRKLLTSDTWEATTPWLQSVVRYYLLPSGLQVRTTTEALYGKDQTLASPPPLLRVSHCIKTTPAASILSWKTAEATPMCPDGAPYDVRVAVRHAEPVFETEIKDRVDEINLVCIKQQISFAAKPPVRASCRPSPSSGCTPGPSSTPAGPPEWRVDVTLAWHRSTFLEAEAALQSALPSAYTVEIKCRAPMDGSRTVAATTAHLSEVLLAHVADLFDFTGTSTARLTIV